MKKLTIALAVLTFLFVGFTVREYVLAPDNVINGIKARQAFEKTQGSLVAIYRAEGGQGVEKRCATPIETAGYWFTCRLVNHFSYETRRPRNEEEFFITEVGLYRWRSRIEAETISVFRQSPSWKGSVVYRVSGQGSDPAYYLSTLDWADARFIELEKRPAKREDHDTKGSGHGTVYP